MAQYLTPALTSVRQPVWEIGQKIIAMLVEIMDFKSLDQEQLLLTPELIIRDSSGRV